jgi:hypothetical protein
MIKPDDITLEVWTIRFREQGSKAEEMTFARVKTKEQSQAIEQGLDAQDPAWVAFDEQVFFYIDEAGGSSIDCFAKRPECSCHSVGREDFYVVL